MRITNSMMSNQMLLNINRNATSVNTLYNRWASTKQYQFPSENPIVASRILKFRTTLAENQQYQKNAAQGLSWMEVTEDGYTECISILKKIRELVSQGDGAETAEDKQKLATQIESLTEQLGIAMNKSYAGRYLFSGYRTDEPGTLLKDDPTLTYTNIKQSFTGSDIENTRALEKDSANNTFSAKDVSIIKLPYKNVTFDSVTIDGVSLNLPGDIEIKSSTDDGAYSPGPDDIYYIQDTGELVLGTNVAKLKNLDVSYSKTGFEKGELNPKVYFECTDKDGKTYTMDSQNIEYEFGVGTRFPINSLAKDAFTSKMYSDLINFCDTVSKVKISEISDVIADLKAKDPDLSDEDARLKALDFIDNEKKEAQAMLGSRFSNMLTIVDNHASALSKSHTDLGTRMDRLEMIQTRLEQDEESFKKLLSENEDADLIETAMLLSNAEAAYQAAMQIGMNIMQVSLVNFL